MAAIDLLFRAKKDSERLHQLVLGTLLGRTRLLARLLPLREHQQPDLGALQWEPEGKAYDLAIPTHSEAGGGEARGRVLVELKLDGALDGEQLDRQLNPRLFRGSDQLLYLLLGYSEATLDRRQVREALQRAAKRDGVPDLPERVHVRGAAEVMAALADPELLPAAGPERADARDLAAAYRDLLHELRDRTTHYNERPVRAFREGDYVGFFAACQSSRAFADPAQPGDALDVVLRRVSAETGSVVTCELGWREVPGGELFLQLENDRLSLRARAATDSQRKKLREQAEQALVTAGLLSPAGSEPAGSEGTAAPRLVPAPPLRRTATIALIENALGEPHADVAALKKSLELIRGAQRCAAASLSRSPAPPAKADAKAEGRGRGA